MIVKIEPPTNLELELLKKVKTYFYSAGNTRKKYFKSLLEKISRPEINILEMMKKNFHF